MLQVSVVRGVSPRGGVHVRLRERGTRALISRADCDKRRRKAGTDQRERSHEHRSTCFPGRPMTTAYITHADCLRHEMGPGHPESPDRLSAVNEQMRSSGLLDELLCLDAPL